MSREFTEETARQALKQAREPNQLVYWCGDLGGFDDFGSPYGEIMYDARTKQGPWANMTQESFDAHSFGKLGTGWGQKYRKQADGRWLKVEG